MPVDDTNTYYQLGFADIAHEELFTLVGRNTGYITDPAERKTKLYFPQRDKKERQVPAKRNLSISLGKLAHFDIFVWA